MVIMILVLVRINTDWEWNFGSSSDRGDLILIGQSRTGLEELFEELDDMPRWKLDDVMDQFDEIINKP